MKILAGFLALSLFAPSLVQDAKTEATQKKIAALTRELRSIQKKMETDPKLEEDPELAKRNDEIETEIRDLAMQASGKDKKKAEQFVMDSLAKFAPEILDEMRRGLVETAAASDLRLVAIAELKFHAEDADANGSKDYWVADVSGLQRIVSSRTSKPIRLFTNDDIVRADAKPVVAVDQAGDFVGGDGSRLPFEKIGKPAKPPEYLFAVVARYRDKAGKEVNLDSGNGRNKERFAFCAYPAAYGKPGKLTFLVDETGAVLGKDTGGAAVTVFPADKAKGGWK